MEKILNIKVNGTTEGEKSIKTLNQTLKDTSKNAQDTNNALSGVSDALKKSREDAVNGLKDFSELKQEFKEIRETLAEMLANGVDPTSESFLRLAERAGQIKDAFSDASATINRFSSDTKGFDDVISTMSTLTNTVGIATGVMNLFGDENKELQQVMTKIQSVMVIINGLQSLSNNLQKQGTVINRAYVAVKAAVTSATTTQATAQAIENTQTAMGGNVATGAATKVGVLTLAKGFLTTATVSLTSALRALWAAMLSNPITAIVAAVGALISAFVLWGNKTEDLVVKQDNLRKKNEELWLEWQRLAEEYSDEIIAAYTKPDIELENTMDRMDTTTKSGLDKQYNAWVEYYTKQKEATINALEEQKAALVAAYDECHRQDADWLEKRQKLFDDFNRKIQQATNSINEKLLRKKIDYNNKVEDNEKASLKKQEQLREAAHKKFLQQQEQQEKQYNDLLNKYKSYIDETKTTLEQLDIDNIKRDFDTAAERIKFYNEQLEYNDKTLEDYIKRNVEVTKSLRGTAGEIELAAKGLGKYNVAAESTGGGIYKVLEKTSTDLLEQLEQQKTDIVNLIEERQLQEWKILKQEYEKEQNDLKKHIADENLQYEKLKQSILDNARITGDEKTKILTNINTIHQDIINKYNLNIEESNELHKEKLKQQEKRFEQERITLHKQYNETAEKIQAEFNNQRLTSSDKFYNRQKTAYEAASAYIRNLSKSEQQFNIRSLNEENEKLQSVLNDRIKIAQSKIKPILEQAYPLREQIQEINKQLKNVDVNSEEYDRLTNKLAELSKKYEDLQQQMIDYDVIINHDSEQIKNLQDAEYEFTQKTGGYFKRYFAELKKMWEEFNWAEKTEFVTEQMTDVLDNISSVINNVADLWGVKLDEAQEKLSEITKLYDSQSKLVEDGQKRLTELQNTFIGASEQQREALKLQMADQIADLRIQKEKERDLLREKEKAQKKTEELEKKQKKSQLRAQLVTAIADVASGVAKALGSSFPPLNFINAGLVSAAGAIEIATITQQLSKLRDGGIVGDNGTSRTHEQGGHRIEGTNIEVEGGEAVIPVRTVQKHKDIVYSLLSETNPRYGSNKTSDLSNRVNKFRDGGLVSTINSNIDYDKMSDAFMKTVSKIRPVVSVVDITEAQNNITDVQNR